MVNNSTHLTEDNIELVIEKTIKNGAYEVDLWFETADTNDSYPVKIGVDVDISTFDSGLGPNKTDNATKVSQQ